MPSFSALTTSLRCAGLALLMAAVPAQPQASRAVSPVESEWLAAHNQARAEVGMAPLAWSAQLAANAAAWARHLAERNLYEHSPPGERRGQGENVWRGTRDRWSPWETVNFFIAEKRDFRFGTFPDISVTGRWNDVGHYAQVIWPDTREVGCAIALTPTEEVLVCRYWSAGNVWGQRIDPGTRVARR